MERKGIGWFFEQLRKEAGEPMERFALDVEALLHKISLLPRVAGDRLYTGFPRSLQETGLLPSKPARPLLAPGCHDTTVAMPATSYAGLRGKDQIRISICGVTNEGSTPSLPLFTRYSFWL